MTNSPARPASNRRTQPSRQSKARRVSYHEETTSDEVTDPEVQRAPHSLRSSNTANARRSYREESTDGSELPDDDDLTTTPGDLTALPPATQTSQRPSRTTRKRTRTNTKSRGQPKKKVRVIPAEQSSTNSGVIPKWQELPYHILFDIFFWAFYPLDSPTTQTVQPSSNKPHETKSVSTLLGFALLCRAFLEPALAVLYYSPPVFGAWQGQSLLHLLTKPVESLSLNYAVKIKELCIDTEAVLSLKSGGRFFDLNQFLQKTTQLNTLRLYHREDLIFGYPSEALKLARWNYPESLFNTLNDSSISLRSWEWNGRFLEMTSLFPMILEKHSSSAFQNLKSLRLVHLFAEKKDTDGEDVLAAALNSLPSIEHLEFHECPIMSGRILERLPPTLNSLTISNCDKLFSVHILKLFKAHGEQLRELTLNHNRHMNLDFISHLGCLCPRLERFRVDFSMFDTSSYRDLDPHFYELIQISQKPTWPDSLQELELYHLRHWEFHVGEMFFGSLIEAAPKLKDLRRLDISAIINGSWRDRATFREKLLRRFEKVFMRHSPPPNPNLRSLRKRPLAAPVPPPGESGSLHPVPAEMSSAAPSKRHSTRIAQQGIPEAFDTNLSDSDTDPVEPKDTQGMCEHISIRIDNQRPADHQFNETDFLDDEPTGDEDWDLVD